MSSQEKITSSHLKIRKFLEKLFRKYNQIFIVKSIYQKISFGIKR